MEPSSIGDTRLRGALNVDVRINVSTFSDNMVISTDPGKAVPYLLREMATIQLMTAGLGFLLRDGITIGDIIHDDEVVFGPGLSRAYDLESKVAKYPRIAVDEHVFKEGEVEGFHFVEDGVYFLDPFTTGFIDRLTERSRERRKAGPSQKFLEAGLPSGGNTLADVPSDVILRDLLEKLKVRIRSPLEQIPTDVGQRR